MSEINIHFKPVGTEEQGHLSLLGRHLLQVTENVDRFIRLADQLQLLSRRHKQYFRSGKKISKILVSSLFTLDSESHGTCTTSNTTLPPPETTINTTTIAYSHHTTTSNTDKFNGTTTAKSTTTTFIPANNII